MFGLSINLDITVNFQFLVLGSLFVIINKCHM
jgi:hypothetical protein